MLTCKCPITFRICELGGTSTVPVTHLIRTCLTSWMQSRPWHVHTLPPLRVRGVICCYTAGTGYSILVADNDSLTTSSYPASIPLPSVDTIPHTLFGPSRQAVGIRASLATTSETNVRLRDMARSISRVIEVEHREALLNDLAELGEAYET